MEKVQQFTVFLLFIIDVGYQIEGSSFNFVLFFIIILDAYNLS